MIKPLISSPVKTTNSGASTGSWLRAQIRVFLIFSVLALTYVLILFRRFLPPAAGWRWRKIVFRFWARSSAAVLGMRISVRGTPPESPYVIISNHLSYVDIIALATRLDAVFIAKKEVEGWPFLGRVIKAFDCIFIDRNDARSAIRVNQEIEAAFEGRKGVLFFPEGTSSAGTGILPFNAALFRSAANRLYPVHFVTIFYRTPREQMPASRSVCWWGDMEFMPHLKDLLRMKTFKARFVFGDRPVRSGQRKDLARQLWQAAQEQFVPVS
jgi:1-acyl-sn-glycerol-3-phosphate acyltransferase